jgi:hypothetical protein
MNTMIRPAAVGGAALLWTWINAATTELFNTTIIVVFLSALGAWLSFSYADDSRPNAKPLTRKRLYYLAVTNTLLAVTCVGVLPSLLGWTWYNSKLEGSVAFLFAFGARHVAPLFLESLPEIFRKWFKIGEYRTAKEPEPKKGTPNDEGL